jgi:hypothetical protein
VIDPEGIPAIPGDMEALAGHAAALRGVANAFATTGQRINATWQQLGGVYQAPEVGQLLAATAPVQTISASVGEDMGTLAGALAGYADEVRQIQAQLASLRSQASGFVASVVGDEHWRRDGGKVDHNNQLISAVDAQLAAFFDAQRRCANAINALYGGPQYRAEDGAGQRREGEYGYTAEALGAAAGQDNKALPWGHTEEQDRGLFGDIGAFFGGIKDGAVGLVTGLGALIGRDPLAGTWSWDTTGTAWKGAGTLVVAAGVYLAPSGQELDQKVGMPGFERGQLGTTLLTAGKGIIAYDEWGKDPARAAGTATFNIVAAVVGTKGVGAGLRTVGTAVRGSQLAAVSSAGTVMVRSGEAIGKLPTVSDLAKNAVRRIPGLRLPNLADTTRITIPHHTDIPTSGAHSTLPTSHPRPGSVGDALSRTPHSGPPGHTEIPSQRVDAATPAHVSAHTHAPAEGRTFEPPSGLHHDPAGPPAGGTAPHTEHGIPGEHGHTNTPAPTHTDAVGNTEFRTTPEDWHQLQQTYPFWEDDVNAVRHIVGEHQQYSGIPESDLVALRGYTRDELSGPMNSALRHGDTAALPHLDPLIRGSASALNQLPEHAGQVFHGIRTDPVSAAEIAARYNPGDVLTEPAFTSASADLDNRFDGPIETIIDSKTGRDITDISHYGALGREVLFAPGTQFEVLERTFNEANQKWQIILREL